MNRIPASISAVEIHGGIAVVEACCGSQHFTATMVGASLEVASWHQGLAVTLLFKETEVALARNLSGMISMRNRFPARVTGLERGRLLTRVDLEYDGHRLASIITTRAADALALAVGVSVEGLVKANEMTVLP